MFTESDFTDAFAANGSLDKVSIFNLMALPGVSDPTVLAAALSFCEGKRAFLIMDPPVNGVADTLAAELPGVPSEAAPIATIWSGGDTTTPAPPVSPNGAIYFPYLQFSGSGHRRGDDRAAERIRGRDLRAGRQQPWRLEIARRVGDDDLGCTTGVVPWGVLTDQQQGVLNPLGDQLHPQLPRHRERRLRGADARG